MIEIEIDQDGCIECGSCEATCDEIFEVPAGEKARIVEEYAAGSSAEGEVEDDLETCANSAADVCPVDVITVET